MGDRTGIQWTDATLFGGPLPRRCSSCREVKPIDQFKVDRSRPDGHGYICRACERTTDLDVPNRVERSNAKRDGKAWCRYCAAWHPLAEIHNGMCREHQREEARARYASDPEHRERRRAHASRRKRGVEPMPSLGRDYYMELFEGGCAYCNGLAETWDHIIPVTKGGRTEPGNILPSCVPCNSSKRDRDLEEWLDATGRHLSLTAAEHLAFFQVM